VVALMSKIITNTAQHSSTAAQQHSSTAAQQHSSVIISILYNLNM